MNPRLYPQLKHVHNYHMQALRGAIMNMEQHHLPRPSHLQLLSVNVLTSSAALPKRTYTTKTGVNAGKVIIKKAQPARNGLLPITSKTLWIWVRGGKFPKPIKLGVRRAVWLASDVEKWLKEQAGK